MINNIISNLYLFSVILTNRLLLKQGVRILYQLSYMLIILVLLVTLIPTTTYSHIQYGIIGLLLVFSVFTIWPRPVSYYGMLLYCYSLGSNVSAIWIFPMHSAILNTISQVTNFIHNFNQVWDFFQYNLLYNNDFWKELTYYYNCMILYLYKRCEHISERINSNQYTWIVYYTVVYLQQANMYNGILYYNYSSYNDRDWGVYYSLIDWLRVLFELTWQLRLQIRIFAYSMWYNLQQGVSKVQRSCIYLKFSACVTCIQQQYNSWYWLVTNLLSYLLQLSYSIIPQSIHLECNSFMYDVVLNFMEISVTLNIQADSTNNLIALFIGHIINLLTNSWN